MRWFYEFGESKWCGIGLVWFVDLWIKTVSQLYTMCSCIRTEQFQKKKSEVVQIINFVRLWIRSPWGESEDQSKVSFWTELWPQRALNRLCVTITYNFCGKYSVEQIPHLTLSCKAVKNHEVTKSVFCLILCQNWAPSGVIDFAGVKIFKTWFSHCHWVAGKFCYCYRRGFKYLHKKRSSNFYKYLNEEN